MPSPFQSSKFNICKAYALSALLVPALMLGACKKAESPSQPSGNDVEACYSPTPPEETAWSFNVLTSAPTQTIGSNSGVWSRGNLIDPGALMLVTQGFAIFMEIRESAFGSADCMIDVEKVYWTQSIADSIPKEFLTPFHDPNPEVIIDHISDEAISGRFGRYFLKTDTTSAFVSLDFDVVNNPCSPSGGLPSTPSYEIINATAHSFPVGDTLNGVTTRWGPSIGLVVLGEEPGANADPSWGMNMFVRGPVYSFGTTCLLTLARAELTVATRRDSFPDIVTYAFPGEEGAIASLNTLLTVKYISDAYISAEGDIPMQRQSFDPVKGFQWHEVVDIDVEFDAKKF